MSAVSYQSRVVCFVFLLLAGAAPAVGQDRSARGLDLYFQTVGSYFSVRSDEIRILRQWGLDHDEVPVVLFIAAQSGLSADAVAVQRSRGMSWPAMVRRYGVAVTALHVPFGPGEELGVLGPLYSRMAGTARPNWNALELSDQEIVTLINVRVLSRELQVSPSRVIQASADAGDFVTTLQRLVSG